MFISSPKKTNEGLPSQIYIDITSFLSVVGDGNLNLHAGLDVDRGLSESNKIEIKMQGKQKNIKKERRF